MSATVLIIGAGDAGLKMAAGLVQSGRLRRLVLAGRCQGRGPDAAGLLGSLGACPVDFVPLDGRRQGDVEVVLRRVRPDLLVQSASLLSPWLALGRKDPVAQALAAAGLGLQLPAQLPVLTAVMQAVRAVGFERPVANLSLPDITHPVLKGRGLAPTVGLGNVSMQLLRVRSALRAEASAEQGGDDQDLPLLRLVGHHKQVYGVMTAQPPADPADRVRVYLGEEGRRADDLAYRGHPLAPSIDYNLVTAAAALPVLLALLPGAAPLRFSAPAPLGLPGGYPLRIADGAVALDLPPGADLEELIAFHTRLGRGDVEAVAEDGTVTFTEEARAALAGVDPALAEPLAPDRMDARFELLAGHLGS